VVVGAIIQVERRGSEAGQTVTADVLRMVDIRRYARLPLQVKKIPEN
jgi:hypothetical protein